MRPAGRAAYRADIDGLRAVAVLPVILFHAHAGWFSGGYVGVDIFFVISGYLITGLLLTDIRQQQFSILKFYERRVRRIFPALFTMLIALTVAGWFLLLPREFNDLGNSLAAATFFYSNYHFMFDAGYFATQAEFRPLLHTWSLAVEEQFYIVFPLLLFLISRFLSSRFALVIWVLLILSLAYGAVQVLVSPQSAFYSTPGRAWELLLGALLAVYPRRQPLGSRLAELLAGLGMAAILIAVFSFDRETPFPGLAALLPCLGAALLIHVGETNRTGMARLLALPPLRATGLISYSLYLWHWPLFVLLRLYAVEPLTTAETGAVVTLTFLLSVLSWRFVEQPFRRRRLLADQRRILTAALATMLLMTGCGIVLSATEGFPGRFNAGQRGVLAAMEDREELRGCSTEVTQNQFELRVCAIGDKAASPPVIAVWGDSHAEAMLPAIDAAASRAAAAGVYLGRDGCLPLLGVHQVRESYESCVDQAAAVVEYLAAQPSLLTVLLISRWSLYVNGRSLSSAQGTPLYIRDAQTTELSLAENRAAFERSLQKTVAELLRLGKRVVLVEQVPEAAFSIPDTSIRLQQSGRPLELRPSLAEHRRQQAAVMAIMEPVASAAEVSLLDPAVDMCSDGYCQVFSGGLPRYRDSNHLTATYARQLAAVFQPLFERLGQPAADRR